ncbi:MAG: kyphoscoliosis peptidase [Bacteroidota bacterium]|jgi:transglutaminase/protease-like cytokinesis protein 3
MLVKIKYFISVCAILFAAAMLPVKAQFETVDNYVKSLGKLDTLNAGSISYLLTNKFSEPKEKVRAIFTWIAFNIDFDCKLGKNGSDEKMTSEEVLRKRKTIANGYAALFQDMCSVAKIRCLTVDGYAKRRTEEIGEKPDAMNHTWAVVQLGQSPDSWHYVDPTWGSGYTDEKMTIYTRSFNPDYFFADRTIFNYQHFPDNSAWLLGAGTKSIKDFFQQPVVKDVAFRWNLKGYSPQNGFIKTKVGASVEFSIRVQGSENIEIVALEVGTEKKRRKKTVDYKLKDGNIFFSFKFEEEDSYPVYVLINNQAVLGYQVEVAE